MMTASTIGRLIELGQCESTNDECMRLLLAGADSGTCVIAASQSGGRGRRGRQWHSSEPNNLYASIILRLDIAPASVAPVSLVAGIAVAEALAHFSVPAQLKWPNDIVLEQAKLGGILTESSGGRADETKSAVVVGIGINISSSPSVETVGQLATSMAEHLGRLTESVDVPTPLVLLRAIGETLTEPLADFVQGGVAAIRSRWLKHWRDLGARGKATIGSEVISGRLVDLSPSGAVVIELNSGDRVAVVAGDVDIDYA